MRRFLLVSALGVALLGGRVLLAADDLVYARFADYLESLRVQAGIPGLTAAVVGKSDIQWEKAFGYQDLERSVAARTDTPMHLDGLTEAVSTSLVLRCVEEGRLSLDDRMGKFKSSSADADLTLRQVLTHTTGSSSNPAYSYRPDRLEPLTNAIRTCTDDSFRETLANLLDELGMSDSVPGPDVIFLTPPAEGVLTSEFDRYKRLLSRLALPYTVDAQKKATQTQYSASTLTPTSGLISTVRNMADFDLALKGGDILLTDTIAAAWRTPVGADGQRLPHGIGWFVQSYNGEPVVWQFGVGEGSSSLMVILPARNLSLILLANSNGLVKSFSLSAGDLTVSPFGKLFLGTFIR